MLKKQSTDELAKILWDYNCVKQTLKKADCLLVLGSNDIRVARWGAELYMQKFAPYIIFSGNVGRLTSGLWNKPEAEVFKKEALKIGVPKDKIIIEDKSTNTYENIIFTKKLLEKRNILFKSYILVHQPYMLRRAFTVFENVWKDKELSLTAPEISYEEYPNSVISKKTMIDIMVGETQRMKIYPEKGYFDQPEIPEKVWNAYKELVKRGFTKYLIDKF